MVSKVTFCDGNPPSLTSSDNGASSNTPKDGWLVVTTGDGIRVQARKVGSNVEFDVEGRPSIIEKVLKADPDCSVNTGSDR